MITVITGIASAAVGGTVTFLLTRSKTAAKAGELEAEAREALSSARSEANTITRDAKREADRAEEQARKRVKDSNRERHEEIKRTEKRLRKREEGLERKQERAEQRIEQIDRRESKIRDQEKHYETLQAEHAARMEEADRHLAEISGFSKEQAREQLMERTVEEARVMAARTVQNIEEEARTEAEKKSKWVIGNAIQRFAGEYVVERAVTVVNLPNDDLKGRIIGREGRNIRAIEAATGCDLIIDDTPEAVVVSSFNPIRREIARLTLEKLIGDGRIHPSRIEEIVAASTKEIDRECRRAADRATMDLGLNGINTEIMNLLGRLKYRYSYAQNVWTHSIEVGFLCGLMASELGLNVKTARRAGLLHDIGKALDHEVEGGHAVIGGTFAKKHGERPEIVNAIAGHHDDVPHETVYTPLASAADALSGARPGARRETLATYVQRLEDLERLAGDFQGVERSYAVQAGREIRVVVEQSKVDDVRAVMLSRDIARKIEEEMTYPGQIKVCVIRETRAVEFAR